MTIILRLALFVVLSALSVVSLGSVAALNKQVDLVPSIGSVHTSRSWGYTLCGSETSAIQIKSLAVLPDPPMPGQNMTVMLTGEVLEDIEEGAEVDVTVKVGIVKLLTRTFDMCEQARNANASIQCPVAKGDHEIEHTVALPKEIPPAKFIVNMRGYTANGDDMVCVDLHADFRKNHIAW